MEKRINKKIEIYTRNLKDAIRDKAIELGLEKEERVVKLLNYVYEYERVFIEKDDLVKRKREKNTIPLHDRCCAKRANEEQCTRRKKKGEEYCGTHGKGIPNGIYKKEKEKESMQVSVWAEDIQGIVYYIDNASHVYLTEDIVSNKINPLVVASYVLKDGVYTIPEYGLC